MSKKKYPTSSNLENCTVAEKRSSRDIALIEKKKHDAWEKKQTFEVIRPDSRTIIYRRVTEEKAKSKSEIHKGRI